MLVSKDSDLAFIHGPPPKVIWLRVGNAATTAIEELLVAAADVVSAFAANEQDAVLVLRPVPGAANNNPIRASGYRDADHPRTPATRQ